MILIPDSAHGTNPAIVGDERASGRRSSCRPMSAATSIWTRCAPLCDEHGRLVGLMLTNPNTLGLFEEHRGGSASIWCTRLRRPDVRRRRELQRAPRHRQAGRSGLRRDALQPAQDLLTPHGGGGPGSGPVGVGEKLVDFLPGPIVDVTCPDGEDETPLYWVRGCRRSRSGG